MDFLKLFEEDIDFDNDCWRIPGVYNFIRFNHNSYFDLASVSSLAKFFDQHRKLIDALLDKYTEPPG